MRANHVELHRSLYRRLFACCAVAATLAACSPYRLDPPPDDPDFVVQPFTGYLDGMATVCVIRSSRIAMAVTFTVHDNDVLVGATRGPTYFCYRAQPGHHRIRVTSEDGEQRFDVILAARAAYYLDQGLDFNLGFVVPQGRWVDEGSARLLVGRSEHRILQGAPASQTILTGTDVAGALPP